MRNQVSSLAVSAVLVTPVVNELLGNQNKHYDVKMKSN